MDALAAAIAKKRKSTQDEFKGRKYVKRAELEEIRIRKLREEEQAEQDARVSVWHAGELYGLMDARASAGPAMLGCSRAVVSSDMVLK
jgi:hypothetical protein